MVHPSNLISWHRIRRRWGSATLPRIYSLKVSATDSPDAENTRNAAASNPNPTPSKMKQPRRWRALEPKHASASREEPHTRSSYSRGSGSAHLCWVAGGECCGARRRGGDQRERGCPRRRRRGQERELGRAEKYGPWITWAHFLVFLLWLCSLSFLYANS